MTPAQLHAARTLIPGAYEPNAPLHQAEVHVPTVDAPYIVAAPARLTRFGLVAAILGDVALCLALIYGVALVPALAMQGGKAAAALVLHTLGWLTQL